ncbi:SGNH/GDSL hydrolase family protein [Gimibacter soli]|uniref:GDSL-type esterase/lipase family protein n=1 Tax=Gimibacter soli TaxID=3024400 RepID=A0AAF0BLI3_9PROT|nr:GDSL-type esterase/lipase family protein [Gimibacter soli]WCL53191.1 GDSL-type esterase/lipase family protein [Gimibacter soli]
MTKRQKFWSRVTVVLLASAIVAFFAARAFYIEYRLGHLEPGWASVADRSGAPSPDIVIFGDSRAANFRGADALLGRGVEIAGIGGDTTPNMLVRLQKDVIERKPDAVIIFAGINDLNTASMLEDGKRAGIVAAAQANLAAMIAACREAGIEVIIPSVTPPVQPDIARALLWGDSSPDVEALNERLAELNGEGVIYLPLEMVLMAGGEYGRENFVDALHYSPLGYERIAAALRGVMDD